MSCPMRAERFAELPLAGQLVLWSLRLWVKGERWGIAVQADLREAYTRVRVEAGPTLVERLMSVIVQGHSRTVEINCTCHAEIGPDEQALLTALAWLRTGETAPAEAALAGFLRPTARRLAAAVLAALAGELAAAGLELEPAGPRFTAPQAARALPAAAGLH